MNKLMTKKEWLEYLGETWDSAQTAAHKQSYGDAIGWYIKGYGAVLGSVRPDLRYEEWRPFYPHPFAREWVGLTDEDCNEIERWIEFKEEGSGPIPTGKLIRYNEAKLKEKNT